jgi:hypothetical protein
MGFALYVAGQICAVTNQLCFLINYQKYVNVFPRNLICAAFIARFLLASLFSSLKFQRN